jgi:hypothetical protein
VLYISFYAGNIMVPSLKLLFILNHSIVKPRIAMAKAFTFSAEAMVGLLQSFY